MSADLRAFVSGADERDATGRWGDSLAERTREVQGEWFGFKRQASLVEENRAFIASTGERGGVGIHRSLCIAPRVGAEVLF